MDHERAGRRGGNVAGPVVQISHDGKDLEFLQAACFLAGTNEAVNFVPGAMIAVPLASPSGMSPAGLTSGALGSTPADEAGAAYVRAAAGQLGSSITDMEQHVTGLQKNLDTLRQIQSALTGK